MSRKWLVILLVLFAMFCGKQFFELTKDFSDVISKRLQYQEPVEVQSRRLRDYL